MKKGWIQFICISVEICIFVQVELHTVMLSLVLVLGLSTLMMLIVIQVIVNYWSAIAVQFCHIIVFTLLTLVFSVKVIFDSNSSSANSSMHITVIVHCNFLHSSLHNWSATIGRRYYPK